MGIFLFLIALLLFCGFASLLRIKGNNLIGIMGPIAAFAGGMPTVFTMLVSKSYIQQSINFPFPFGLCNFEFDIVSAIFMIPLLLIGMTAAFYGGCICKPEHAVPGRPIWFFFNLLMAGIMLILVSANTLMFLLGWEIMSWSSFFLICTYHRKNEVRTAGIIYFIATHIGVLLIITAFLLLQGQVEDFNFSSFLIPESGIASVIFILALIGFGAKAGLVPFHVWLPEAHPAAPGYISAVLSGVMCKVGIYGIVRTLLLMPEHQLWWGWILLLLGAISAVYGIILALAQQDFKRLLAYSTVENLGIISMGLGMGVLAAEYDMPDISRLFFVGSALHVINHAIFKGLLFMAAGSILNQTGEHDLNRLGGLLKRMPSTATFMLIGCAAICGLPPFNGFIGEFVIFTQGLECLTHESWYLPAAAVLMLTALGLTGGLAMVCFSKLAGIILLGEPRSRAAEDCIPVNPGLRFPLGILAGLCLCLGIFLPLLLSDFMAWKISLIFIILIVLCTGLYFWRRKLAASAHNRTGITWDCGYVGGSNRIQYTGSGLVQPLTRFFKPLMLRKKSVKIPSGIFPDKGRWSIIYDDLILDAGYRQLFDAIKNICFKLRWIQSGHLNRYILYIALVLILLLIWELL